VKHPCQVSKQAVTMKRCFVLLLLALHAYTVSGVCECNSDGADVIELSPETNTLFSHTIKCDDESSLPLACNLTITGGADTTVAVAFPSTNLNATDTDNNIAKLLNATGSKLVTVTTTETKELTSTKSHIATVTADLTKNGEVTFQYIAAIGSDTEKACGTPDESRLEVLTLNEDTCISSPNFPTNYPPS
ncbi:uncharacterized protein LOC110459043, partial [Mizuhopecten yessoensis]|uniref:uncharacterized protein LOC110459043 n=1 Tax=Mizuhopecten yessoensis TaxID=6573 RepID=UPI000B45DD2B